MARFHIEEYANSGWTPWSAVTKQEEPESSPAHRNADAAAVVAAASSLAAIIVAVLVPLSSPLANVAAIAGVFALFAASCACTFALLSMTKETTRPEYGGESVTISRDGLPTEAAKRCVDTAVLAAKEILASQSFKAGVLGDPRDVEQAVTAEVYSVALAAASPASLDDAQSIAAGIQDVAKVLASNPGREVSQIRSSFGTPGFQSVANMAYGTRSQIGPER